MPTLRLAAFRFPEPKAIATFIKEGHPWMGLAFGLAWLATSILAPATLALVLTAWLAANGWL